MTDKAKPGEPARPKVSKRTENWAEDQHTRGYYYDDAHGYEAYDPEEEGEDETEAETDEDRTAS